MPARLPDLVVIGAPRSGTTTLSAWLAAHPEVAFSAEKELEFFDRHHERGVGWYLEQLPAEPGDRVVAEATPTYLSEPGVADRVVATLPDARFVALLREPVARAWSNYWFFRQLGLERRQWEDVVADERDDDPVGYLWRGRYADQLARWDALAGPDRLHVALFDDLVQDPASTYAGVCRFAGVEEREPPARGPVNPARQPRSVRLQRRLRSTSAGPLRRRLYAWNAQGRPVPSLPPAQHAALKQRFAASNAELEKRLGRPLPPHWWA